MFMNQDELETQHLKVNVKETGSISNYTCRDNFYVTDSYVSAFAAEGSAPRRHRGLQFNRFPNYVKRLLDYL